MREDWSGRPLFLSIVVGKPAFGLIRHRKMTEGINENEDAMATYSKKTRIDECANCSDPLSHPSENFEEMV